MKRVQISAKIIKWPNACACCLGKADTSLAISERGRSWDVPYCSGCLAHVIHAQNLASAKANHHPWRIVYSVIRVVFGFPLAFFGFVATLAARDAKESSISICLGMLALATLPAGAYLALRGIFGIVAASHSTTAAESKITIANDGLDRTMSDNCTCEEIAAAYESWHGTVHTFLFANERYAAAFIEANRNKVLA